MFREEKVIDGILYSRSMPNGVWQIVMKDSNTAKKLEKLSKWREAGDLWVTLGEKDHADACYLIADAVKKGDEFRAAIQAEVERHEQTMKTLMGF